MGLHCTTVGADCPFDVAGFTFSGVPGVVIGHNQDIAWGFTNMAPDVTDLYLEKVDGDRYEYAGQQLPLAVRTETIRVAGEEPHTIRIRSTRHGPLLSDVSKGYRRLGRKYAVALQWTALTPGRTMDALFALDRGHRVAGHARGRGAVRGARAEHRLRRHRRAHRLPVARQDPGALLR